MIMKHTLSILIFFSFIFNASYAQDESPEGKDPKAKAVLDEIAKKTEALDNLQLKFHYQIINNQTKQTQSYKGHAFIKGNKYKLIIPALEIISDGNSVWTYQKEVREVSIQKADPEDESIFNPAKLYTIYKRGFKYQYLGEHSRDGMNLAIIDLYPEQPGKKSFTRVRVEADTDKNRIISFTTFGKDGIDYVVEFSDFKPNIKIPDGFFTFNEEKYPDDTEVIDMR